MTQAYLTSEKTPAFRKSACTAPAVVLVFSSPLASAYLMDESAFSASAPFYSKPEKAGFFFTAELCGQIIFMGFALASQCFPTPGPK